MQTEIRPVTVFSKVMSFNLLNGDVTDTRIGVVIEMIGTELPDSLGTQECGSNWYISLNDALSDRYSVYTGGSFEQKYVLNAIFYRKDKYELIESASGCMSLSDKAIADDGETEVESTQPRSVVWVALKNKDTGEIFVHYNLHVDYGSWAIIKQQLADLKVLTDACEYPYVITGDFNLDMHDTTGTGGLYYSSILCQNWRDARVEAEVSTNARTSSVTDTSYAVGEKTYTAKTLDYCLISKYLIDAQVFDVVDTYVSQSDYQNRGITDKGDWISDHLPVFVEFYIQ